MIFNEENHADYMLQNGFYLKKSNQYELTILAKYYITKENLNKPKTKEKLIEFCNINDSEFDEFYLRNIINKAIDKGKKFDFINIEDIGATEGELKIIRELDDIKYEKIAFVMLIISKISNELNKQKIRAIRKKNDFDEEYIDRYFVCNKHSELMNLAKVKVSVKIRNKIFKDLENKKLIKLTKKCNFEVLFIDNQNNKNAIDIISMDEFVLLYLQWRGEKIVQCTQCGRLVKVKGKKVNKYCEECAKEIDRKKALERWHNRK